MNLSEFKAWFDGFTENLDGPPTTKQWKRVQDKVAEIKEMPATTYHTFIRDHYYPWWHQHHHHYHSTPNMPYFTTTCVGLAQSNGAMNLNNDITYQSSQNHVDFDSSRAFTDLGRAEYQTMLASE